MSATIIIKCDAQGCLEYEKVRAEFDTTMFAVEVKPKRGYSTLPVHTGHYCQDCAVKRGLIKSESDAEVAKPTLEDFIRDICDEQIADRVDEQVLN